MMENRQGEVNDEDESDKSVQEVGQKGGLEAANCSIENNCQMLARSRLQCHSKCLLTSKRYDYASRHKVHAGYTVHKLRASQDHTGAAKHIVDQIHDNEDSVPNLSISLLDDLERRVGVGYSDFRHHAQGSHQSNLEA